MPNIRHIAKVAGVSITTVSRVLNSIPGVSETSRKAVLAVVNKSGYVPKVARRSTTNIALLYTDAPTLDSPFDAALLVGLYEGLEKMGYDLMVLDAHRSRQPGETFSQMFRRKGVKGALVRATTSSQALCREIAQEGFPAVVMGYRFEESRVHWVYSDSRDASAKAIEHLYGLGHRRIGVCIHVVEDSDHADRVAAYRHALELHGIDFDERLVIRVPANRDGGVQVVRRMRTITDRPTALFLTDPLISVGVLGEARRMGLRVPGDLSVVGFDDAELRYALVPQLTSVCQNTKHLGREAVSMLCQVIANRGAAGPVTKALRCWLEVHESTGTHQPSAQAIQPTRTTGRPAVARKLAASGPLPDHVSTSKIRSGVARRRRLSVARPSGRTKPSC
jgi:DNA-binding LacI/PurR family transcriptional regulator